jgi:uncharacterized protein YbjT (DUF2867 family)
MKILVTGGTGKVGAEVVKELQKRKVQIRLLVRKEGGGAEGSSGCHRRFARPGVGMVHVFPANLALLQAARGALDITGEFLRCNLGR